MSQATNVDTTSPDSDPLLSEWPSGIAFALKSASMDASWLLFR